jgi:hypothetical protein
MPRKVFTAGEVLAAADVNEFLQDQAVMSFAGTAARGSAIGTAVEGMVTYLNDSNSLSVYNGTDWTIDRTIQVFAGTAARGSAIPSPVEGMYAHLNDTDTLTYYNGSAWANSGASALELVKSQTVGSAVASVVVTDCFNSTYDNYKIVYNDMTSSSGQLKIQLTSITTGYAYNDAFSVWNSGYTGRGSNSSSSFTGGDYYVNFDLMNPNRALRKSGFGISNDNNATLFLNFYNASTTQSTGFTLSATSMTGGTIYVYGYKKA